MTSPPKCDILERASSWGGRADKLKKEEGKEITNERDGPVLKRGALWEVSGGDSVEVAEAGRLAGFLHERSELELLPRQQPHVLEEDLQVDDPAA